MLACSHARMRAQQEVALERMCRKKERRRRNERGEERKERDARDRLMLWPLDTRNLPKFHLMSSPAPSSPRKSGHATNPALSSGCSHAAGNERKPCGLDARGLIC